jgi:hypothetical protein
MLPDHDEGIRNLNNTLTGGSITVKEAKEFLCRNGHNKNIIHKAISENPEKYLQIS